MGVALGGENAGWTEAGVPKKETGLHPKQDECQFHKLELLDKIFPVFC